MEGTRESLIINFGAIRSDFSNGARHKLTSFQMPTSTPLVTLSTKRLAVPEGRLPPHAAFQPITKHGAASGIPPPTAGHSTTNTIYNLSIADLELLLKVDPLTWGQLDLVDAVLTQRHFLTPEKAVEAIQAVTAQVGGGLSVWKYHSCKSDLNLRNRFYSLHSSQFCCSHIHNHTHTTTIAASGAAFLYHRCFIAEPFHMLLYLTNPLNVPGHLWNLCL